MGTFWRAVHIITTELQINEMCVPWVFHDCYEWQNDTSAAWTSATYRRDMWWIDQNEEVTWLSLHCPLQAFASDSISPPVRRVDRRAESWVHVVSYRRAGLQPVWNRQSRIQLRKTERLYILQCESLRGFPIRWNR